MSGIGRRRWTLFMLGILVLTAAGPFSAAGQEKPEAALNRIAPAPQEAGEAPSEAIHPGPKNLREKWAIGVFLAWMWLSIAVFIYIIRLQIREADRVTELAFDNPIKIRRNVRTP